MIALPLPALGPLDTSKKINVPIKDSANFKIVLERGLLTTFAESNYFSRSQLLSVASGFKPVRGNMQISGPFSKGSV